MADVCDRCGGDTQGKRICPLCRRVAHPKLKVVPQVPSSSSDTQLPPEKENRKNLDEVDVGLIGYLVTDPALSTRRLAALIGMSPTQVEVRRKKPLFQFHLKRQILESHKSARKVLEELQPRAARKLGKHLESQTESISLRAAEDILRPLLGAEQMATITVELKQLIQSWNEK